MAVGGDKIEYTSNSDMDYYNFLCRLSFYMVCRQLICDELCIQYPYTEGVKGDDG